MRLAGRAGVFERAVPANPLARLAVGAAALFFVIVAVASMGSAVLLPRSEAACATSLELGEVKGLPAEAREFVRFYLAAAEEYRLGERGPSILAAIHSVETGFGELADVTSSAGAVGHMQFMPATWDMYGVDANGDGEKDPYDPEDAIHGAANYLRASGAPGDWHAAIFAYNHAEWYVDEVFAAAGRFGDVGSAADADLDCSGSGGATGPAELSESVRLYEPKGFKFLPADLVAPGFGQIKVEERVYANVVWLLRRYGLVLTAGAESAHNTHGDGTAIDAVPASGSSLATWQETAERAARDLGWTPACASSGVAPVCDLAPAIHAVFYNGFDSKHGDPAHTRIPHIHISWNSSSYGTSTCCPSPEWIDVFPSPGGAE